MSNESKIQVAKEILAALKIQGKKGREIAEALYAQHVHYNDAARVLRDAGFIVSVENFHIGIKELYVSDEVPELDFDNPLSALAILLPVQEPKTLPSVIWWPDVYHPDATAERSSYRYSKSDPHWTEAQEVRENAALGPLYVDVLIHGRWYMALRKQWNNPFFDKSKSDVLLETEDMGWLRVWFNDSAIQVVNKPSDDGVKTEKPQSDTL